MTTKNQSDALEGTAPETPFHEGELAFQDRLGVRERVHSYAPKFIRPYLPAEHRDFFAQLPQMIVGSADGQGRPWASMVPGRPGFASSPDPIHLKIGAPPLFGDPLNENLTVGAPLGFLGIEFATRRRNRLTGKVTDVGDADFTVSVDHSFGNCPQYIQARNFEISDGISTPQDPRPVTRRATLDKAAQTAIGLADTLFIASMYFEDADDRRHGVDVSHRGGKPGFVQVVDEKTLVFPDFAGNFHFNTLGNILMYPKAGLLFPDFDTGNMLYITGNAEIIFDGAELDGFEGAERLVRITIEEIIRVENSLPLRWKFQSYAPDLARTGDWQQAGRKAETEADKDTWRRFLVARVEAESETISSFYLAPKDGKPLQAYKPGQYLPIRLDIPGEDSLVSRTYTLSQAPGGDYYRLSIKRETNGLVSRHMHDRMTPGSTLEVMAPRGKFTLEEDSHRPVVLLSGGVGITPMISMLESLLQEEGETGNPRPIYFLHGTKNGSEQAFTSHLKNLADKNPCLSTHICFSEPRGEDVEGVDFDSAGHIDRALLQSLLPLDDYDVYLCGPQPFMRALFEAVSLLGVAEGRIHYESFGPAMVLKPSERAKKQAVVDQPAEGPISVRFSKSGIDSEWRPEKGTLLELAEAEGLSPAYSCRGGLCGTCAVNLKCGDVDYLDDPVGDHDDDQVLICCSTPKAVQGEATCGEEFGVILEL